MFLDFYIKNYDEAYLTNKFDFEDGSKGYTVLFRNGKNRVYNKVALVALSSLDDLKYLADRMTNVYNIKKEDGYVFLSENVSSKTLDGNAYEMFRKNKTVKCDIQGYGILDLLLSLKEMGAYYIEKADQDMYINVLRTTFSKSTLNIYYPYMLHGQWKIRKILWLDDTLYCMDKLNVSINKGRYIEGEHSKYIESMTEEGVDGEIYLNIVYDLTEIPKNKINFGDLDLALDENFIVSDMSQIFLMDCFMNGTSSAIKVWEDYFNVEPSNATKEVDRVYQPMKNTITIKSTRRSRNLHRFINVSEADREIVLGYIEADEELRDKIANYLFELFNGEIDDEEVAEITLSSFFSLLGTEPTDMVSKYSLRKTMDLQGLDLKFIYELAIYQAKLAIYDYKYNFNYPHYVDSYNLSGGRFNDSVRIERRGDNV